MGVESPTPSPARWIPAALLLCTVVLTRYAGRAGFELGLLLALLAGVAWSLARRPPRLWEWHLRHRALGALFVGIAILLPLVSWSVWSQRRVPRRIAAVVPLFPGAHDPMDGTGPLGFGPMVRALEGDTAGAHAALAELRAGIVPTYLMHTEAPPASVIAFYRDATHRPGLEIVEDDAALLFLRGNGLDVMVGAIDEGYGRGTVIAYTWRPARGGVP